MTVVGEAEIIARLNGKGVRTELAALKDETAVIGDGLSSGISGAYQDEKGRWHNAQGRFISEAEVTGQAAGANLRGGVEKELKKGEHGGGFNKLLSGLGVPSELLGGWGELGIAVAGVGLETLHLASNMQKADASIATSEGISVKAATNIGNGFLNTAGKVEFSGIEQAKAFALVAGQLATTEGRALSEKESMEFMAHAMDLATATGMDLGASTQALSGLMQAFQIPVKGAAHAADVLFNTSRMTGQGLDTVANSLEKLRGKLGATAPRLGDLASLMVQMTKEGITGRAALAAVNAAATGLAGAAEGTSKSGIKARDALHEFGLSATDAKGNVTPLQDIIEGLAPRFTKMTQAQQLSTAATIFGSGAAKQMTAVIDAGAKSFERTTAAVNKQNSAQHAASIQSATLKVEFKTIVAALEDWGVKIGTWLIPKLEGLVQIIIRVGKTLYDAGKFIFQHKELLIALGIVVASILIPILVEFVAGLVATTAAFVAEGIAAAVAWAATLGPIALIIAAVIAVALAVYEIIHHWSAIAHFFERLWDGVKKLFDIFIHFVMHIFDVVIDWIKKHWELLVGIIGGPIGAVIMLFIHFRGKIFEFFDDIWHKIVTTWDWFRHETAHLVDDVVGFFDSLPMKVIHIIEHAAGAVLKAFEKWIPGGGLIGGAISGIAHLFGEGGIVSKPTLGIIGEKGPEAVIPLSKFNVPSVEPSVADLASRVGPVNVEQNAQASTVNHGDLNVYIQQPHMTPAEIEAEFSFLYRSNQLIGVG